MRQRGLITLARRTMVAYCVGDMRAVEKEALALILLAVTYLRAAQLAQTAQTVIQTVIENVNTPPV